MCSEHGNLFLLQWGCVRGRKDIRLFEDDLLFEDTVKATWALINYIALGCPVTGYEVSDD